MSTDRWVDKENVAQIYNRIFAVESLSCIQLCDPKDCSPPGSSVHGFLQVRILEWVSISYPRWSSWSRDWTWISCTGRRVLYHWASREAQWDVLCCAKPLQSCLTLQPHRLEPTRLLCPWDSPGTNTGVGCYALLQEIFLTQGLNPCLLHLLHYRQILYYWANGETPRGYYSTIKKKKKEIIPFAATWMSLEIIILSEIRKTNTIWYHLYVESKIWCKWTHLWSSNRITDTENRFVVAKWEGWRRGGLDLWH